MFNVQDIKSVIGKHGVARPSNYAVNITPPNAIPDQFIQELPFLIDTANLPSISFDLENTRYKGYGLVEQRPVGTNFEPVTITVIGDASGLVLSFFQKWLSWVMNFDGETSASTLGVPSETINYPTEYWGTIEIWLYDITAKQYHSYKLNKAFPITLGSVQLGWEQSDSLMRIPVTFSYRSPTTTTLEQLGSQSSPINTIVNSNSRNVQQLQNLLVAPNIEQYQARFLSI